MVVKKKAFRALIFFYVNITAKIEFTNLLRVYCKVVFLEVSREDENMKKSEKELDTSDFRGLSELNRGT